ncbi:Hypothetical_protein [Hexamita inflata]|uniref:Hypothetical_protein n=1 Tax=Hexamita inflata TaxID=28002 RepID=A0AA86NHM0_9EUKA|nr:Hypothetical protein HINF_LOCUS6829 [Hexamita inflata]
MLQISDSAFLTMAALVLNNLTAESKTYSHQSLIYSILMLDNEQFDLFWLSFSQYTNIPVSELKITFNTLATNILSNNYTHELDSFQFRKSVYRQQSQSVIQFRNLFTGVLKRVLNVFFNVYSFNVLLLFQLFLVQIRIYPTSIK